MKLMKDLFARSSKGQLKIQQMAFVLVAFTVLLGVVALFYFSVTSRTLTTSASDLRQEQAQAQIQKFAGTPEFAWTSDSCSQCIDFDKIFALSSVEEYRSFWSSDIVRLEIKKIDSESEIVCSSSNYPDCNRLVIVAGDKDYVTEEAFVALCRFDPALRERRCDIGKIVMGVRT